MNGHGARWLLLLPLALAALASGCGGARDVSRVVVVTLDTTRVDRLGCYGSADASTPHLDRLAAEGVVFDNAVSTVPTTLPAHTTIFSGQLPPDHGVRYNIMFRVPDETETLAEIFTAAGYATAAFPASRIVSRRFGLDQGFALYDEPEPQDEPDPEHPLAGQERVAKEGVDRALDWLAGQDGSVFVWLHFYDPHWPYEPPFPYSAEYATRPYDGEISYMDAQLGRFLAALRDDPAWDSTLLVVVADHGEGLYEHGERWHTMLLYETTQHIPLIVRAPGTRPRRVADPVSLVDLAPTILDLSGLEPRPAMRGISLGPALRGDPLPLRDVYFESLAGSLTYGWAELRGLRSGRWKLVDDGRSPELYDLALDPTETTNLASNEPQRMADLRDALGELSAAQSGTADPAAAEVELDPETLAQMESLGYIGGGGGGSIEGAPHPLTMIDLEPELLAAQQAVAQRNWPYVEDLCRYTLQRDPTNKWALTKMTDALLGQGKLDAALAHARIVPGIYPDNPIAWAKVGEALAASGRHQEAYEAVSEGLAQLPGTELLDYFALVAAFDASHADVCSDAVPAAVTAHPKSARIRVMQARCAARGGELEGALAELRAAAALGFRSFTVVEEAPDFSALVAGEAYRALRTELDEGEERAGSRSPAPGV